MNISTVKKLHLEAFPTSHFFDRATMRFNHQTMHDFRVFSYGVPGYWYVEAPMRDAFGVVHGFTRRVFSLATGALLSIEEAEVQVRK